MIPGLPTPASAFALASVATVVWTAIGWPLARGWLPPAIPAAAAAPALGWCVQTTVAAVLLPLLGFSQIAVGGVFVGCLALSWASRQKAPTRGTQVPTLLPVLAALAAVVVAISILPKHHAGAIALSAPIFDHSKIALVDAIRRGGLPPNNPFYGGDDGGGGLAYYWWWHFSAAELSRVARVSGWAADASLTGFAAYASLLLVGGLGAALAGRIASALSVLLLLPGSLHWALASLERRGWLHEASGLGGWLNQASWAPQHLAAGCALVLAALLLAQLAETPGPIAAVLLGAVVAAGFGSSTWVGGVTAGAALTAAAGLLLWRLPQGKRAAFVAHAVAAAGMALLAVLPLVRAQWAAASLRGGGLPMALQPYPVLGAKLPGAVMNVLAAPLLVGIEYPALVVLAGIGVALALRRGLAGWQAALLVAGAVGLLTTLLVRSTVDNNDLGWRAILPTLLVGAPFAAAAARHLYQRRSWWLVLALALALLGLPGAGLLLADDLHGRPGPGDPAFAASAPAWAALKTLSGPADRVASDPNLTAGMTPWPSNIAWALLADRPSCYAGWATAHVFTPLPAMRLYATDQEIGRVFAGTPSPGDVADLSRRLHCTFALLLPGDPAWTHDPFAASPKTYRLIQASAGWRIYRAVGP